MALVTVTDFIREILTFQKLNGRFNVLKNFVNEQCVHQDEVAATVAGNKLIKRAANGTAKVAAPVASDDIARKAEVDAHEAKPAPHSGHATKAEVDAAWKGSGTKAIAVGDNTSATGDNGVAVGNVANALGTGSVAAGANTSATANNGVAVGFGAEASEGEVGSLGAVALGGATKAAGDSVAVGYGTRATARASLALGVGASTKTPNQGVLGGNLSTHTNTWLVPGSFSVSGTKNFEIPHPNPAKKETHLLRHGSVESPSPGETLYRWKIDAKEDNSTVTIPLPDYFMHLNEHVQIFVTGQGHFGNGYGIYNEAQEGLEIHCKLAGEYNVLAIGTRKDDHQSVKDWSIKGVERRVDETWNGTGQKDLNQQ